MRITLPLILMLCLSAQAAVAPLSDQDKRILDDVTDDTAMLDGPGVYPLLRNALRWSPDDRAGAMIPDYDQLHASPGQFRGQLFLIEGQFAGKYRDLSDLKVGKLSRPGLWDDKLEQWPIVVKTDPKGDTANDEVAIVWLVNPVKLPPAGTRVEIIARFYKIWRVKKLNQTDEAEFPVFVGHTAMIRTGEGGTSGAGGGSGGDTMLFGLLIAAAAGWFVLRKVSRRKRSAGDLMIQRRLQRRQAMAEEADDEDDDSPPLPTDAAAALDELEQRKRRT